MNFFCVFSILFMLQPAFLSEIPVYSDLDVFIRLVLVLSLFFLYIYRRKISVFFLLTAFYILVTLIATIFYSGEIARAVWGNGLILLSIVVACELGTVRCPENFLKISFYLFFFLVFINFLSLIFFPEGLFYDERGIKADNFVFGNYNSFIIYIFTALLCGYLFCSKLSHKHAVLFICFCIISFGSFFGKSMTSLFGFSLVIAYLVLFNKRIWRFVLNMPIYLTVITFAVLLLVVMQAKSPLIQLVTEIIGKDITFTGRTDIWAHAMEHITASPWIGYGYQPREVNIEWLGSIHAVNPHNLYLGVLYYSGIIGGIFFLLLFLLILLEIRKFHTGKVKGFLQIMLFSYLIMSLFEFYDLKFTILFFCLIYTYCKAESSKAKSQLTTAK